jgi:hypothetical protein
MANISKAGDEFLIKYTTRSENIVPLSANSEDEYFDPTGEAS